MNLEKIKNLLYQIEILQKHQREIEKIKGETFNIFSILGVETKENKTHSNFIAELLNPKGSHYMGNVFLEEFLKIIGYKGGLNTHKAQVYTEFYIGPVEPTTGGRIDIFIKDAVGNCISIENKIYAGDQENQLIRYHNYQKGKNTLYYLTLFGGEASEYSTEFDEAEDNKIELKANEDYFPIGYNNEILNWLKKCHQIAVDVPQLRDSIKQYILLIKKLTNQMIDTENKELKKAIFDNIEAAKYIADNFDNIKNEIKDKFRNDVFNLLKERLKTKHSELEIKIEVNGDIAQQNASILLSIPSVSNELDIWYRIESFSSGWKGNLFIGIRTDLTENIPFNIPTDYETGGWLLIRNIKFNNEHINLDSIEFLQKLVKSTEEEYTKIVEKVVEQSINFIDETYPTIVDYFNKKGN